MSRHTTTTRLRVARTMRHSQRGAAVIMTAGFMLLGVLCLALAVDTGRLYMEKRSLQRIADVIALEVASRRGCVPDVNDVVQAQSLAAAALASDQALPASYWRYARIWFWLGIPAFFAMLAIYALMVFKPQ